MNRVSGKPITFGVLVCMGLALFGVCLFGLGLMKPAAAQAPNLPRSIDVQPTRLTSLDSRWLQLIRGEAPQPGSAPSQVQSPQTLNVLLSDHLVAGHVSNGNLVFITVTSGASLVVTATVKPTPDAGGFLFAAELPSYVSPCSPVTGFCTSYQVFSSGHVVQIMQSSNMMSLTIPSLSAFAFADDDSIRGSGPASQTVTAYVFTAANPNVPFTQNVTSDISDRYAISFAGIADVRAKDSGYVAHSEGAGKATYAQFVAPQLRVQLAPFAISGYAVPQSWYSVQIGVVDGSPLGISGFAENDGSFLFNCCIYPPVSLRPGTAITFVTGGLGLTQTVLMTVAELSAAANFVSGQVSGQAPANQLVRVALHRGPIPSNITDLDALPVAFMSVMTASATGVFTANAPLLPGDFGTASAMDANGHETVVRFALPYVWVRMGGAVGGFGHDGVIATGQLTRPLGIVGPQPFVALPPITLTVQGKSGRIKDIRSASIGGYGTFVFPATGFESFDRFDGLLSSGDVITVNTESGVEMQFVLPTLTAQADADLDIVTGTAPPNAVLNVRITHEGSTIATRTITATAQGVFTANFAGLYDVVPRSQGEVEYLSPQGFVAARSFWTKRYCVPELYSVEIGYYNLHIFQQPGCSFGEVRIFDANNIVKASGKLGNFLPNPPTNLAIQSGDAIELGDGMVWQRYVVPTLTVGLDTAANRVFGRAPANSEVRIQLDGMSVFGQHPSEQASITATVDANGTYSRSLTRADGSFKIAPGTSARISVGSSPEYVRYQALPRIRAYLNRVTAEATLFPNKAATLTLQSPGLPPSWVVFGSGAVPRGTAFTYFTHTIRPKDVLLLQGENLSRTLFVSQLTAQFKGASAELSGEAPPNAVLKIQAPYTYGPCCALYTQWVTATANGRYSATLTNLLYVAVSSGVVIYTDAQGNEVVVAISSDSTGKPSWQVTIGGQQISGNGFPTDVQGTLTLKDKLGRIKSQVSVFNYSSEYQILRATFTTTVQAQDRIEWIQPDVGSSLISLIVPDYAAFYDARLNAVIGKVGPNKLIWIGFGQGGLGRRVFADLSGHFELDTTGVALRPLEFGIVNTDDNADNYVSILFYTKGLQRYIPLVFR